MINIIKLNQLPSGSGTLSDDDILLFMDDPTGSGTTKKITFGEISNLIGSSITNPITIVGGDYISSNLIDDTYTISVTGLQPSGNYSLVGHTHLSTDITDSTSFGRNILTAASYAAQNKLGWEQIDSSSFQAKAGGQYFVKPVLFAALINYAVIDPISPSVGDFFTIVKYPNSQPTVIGGITYSYDQSILIYRVYQNTNFDLLNPTFGWVTYTLNNFHVHTSSDITNFNSSVSGLLPSIIGSGYVNSSFNNNTYTISVTGLQPSGNYSLVDHTHTSSNITDFNSSVSGLIPVKNIISGTGINVSNLSGIYTISSTGSGVLADQAASLVTNVFNKTGSPIPKMTAVYINGGQGDIPTISLAQASGELTSSKTYGLTAETIGNMSIGKVIVFGALTGLNTDQFNPTAPTGDVNGTTIYLSPTVAGGLTTTKPSAPNHMVAIGTIIRTHQNEGIIEVRVQNGFELEELHNVAISGVTNGQFLQYNSSSQLWVPSSSGNFSMLSVNGTGVSVNGHTHSASQITDFGSSVSGLLPVKDIIAGSNITISNTSGNYTINSSENINITNFGNDKILTSNGTSSGINAENNFLFNSTTSQLKIVYDPSVGHSGNNAQGSIRLESYGSTETPGGIANRIIAFRSLGSEISPSGLVTNNAILSIRADCPNSSGIPSSTARLVVQTDGIATGSNLYAPSRLTLNSSSGPGQFDNSLVLYSDGQLNHNGYMIIEDGLSAPTPILSLGSVSGNVAINYGVDRQIQRVMLSGAAVNFTKGTNWDLINRSVDVMLEITVSSTTTVAFDSGFITDWYDPLPIFSSGKYLILLRSMGVGIIQGHYIGAKTN